MNWLSHIERNWLKIFNRQIRSCFGMELHIRPDGIYHVRLVELEYRHNQIHILKKTESFLSDIDLSALRIKGPLALTITGKGILIKKTEFVQHLDSQHLQQIFPGYSKENYIIQQFKSGNECYVAFVRRETMLPIYRLPGEQGIELLICSLGPFVLMHIIPLLNHYNTTLAFDGHQISLNEHEEWLDYRYVDNLRAVFDLKIDIDIIEERYLLAYASAFQLLLHQEIDLIKIEEEKVDLALVEYQARLNFRFRFSFMLVLCTVILLSNFSLFHYYNTRNQHLSDQAGLRSDLYANRKNVEDEIFTKEKLVRQLGWNHSLSYAYICDQIGQTLPEGLVLTSVAFNDSSTKIEGRLNSPEETGFLRINGIANHVYPVNNWIYMLKKQVWIRQVYLEKYAVDQQKGLPLFSLLIIY